MLGGRRPRLVLALSLGFGTAIAVHAPLAHASPPTCRGHVATIVGTNGDDHIWGTAQPDVIAGLRGDDVIRGREGDDIICGNAGDNVIYGGPGNDRLTGEPRDIHSPSNKFFGGRGDDVFYNTFYGRDVYELGPDDDTVRTPYVDYDALAGCCDVPVDFVAFRSARQPVSVDLAAGRASGQGHDTLSSWVHGVIGSDYADVIKGADHPGWLRGHDDLRGGGGDDRIFGRRGQDVLSGDGGDDFLDGGLGANTASYERAPRGVHVDLVSASATGEGDDVLVGMENVIGSMFADHLVGDGNGNNLQGLAGSDALDGGAGEDTMLGGSGNDELAGEGGPDQLTGGVGADILHGGDENDELNFLFFITHRRRAMRGSDVLDGGAGDDHMSGGEGNDDLMGGDGIDRADYTFAPGGVTVDLAQGTASGEGDDLLQGVEDVFGSAHDDTLLGDAGPNFLASGQGEDVLQGRAGDDGLAGSSGDDRLDGEEGTDTVYAGTTTSVTVDLAAGTTSGGDGNDLLTGIENAVGGLANDMLLGDDGPNHLEGYFGDDTLDGRAGDDSLDGNDGTDEGFGGPGTDSCVSIETPHDCET